MTWRVDTGSGLSRRPQPPWRSYFLEFRAGGISDSYCQMCRRPEMAQVRDLFRACGDHSTMPGRAISEFGHSGVQRSRERSPSDARGTRSVPPESPRRDAVAAADGDRVLCARRRGARFGLIQAALLSRFTGEEGCRPGAPTRLGILKASRLARCIEHIRRPPDFRTRRDALVHEAGLSGPDELRRVRRGREEGGSRHASVTAFDLIDLATPRMVAASLVAREPSLRRCLRDLGLTP